MAEVFKEYLIKQKKSPKDVCMQVGLIAGAIILAIIMIVLRLRFIGPLAIVIVVFGAGYLFTKFNREYEYILTNNELDIDVIYNRSSRKRVMTINMRKIDIMASIKDERHMNELNRPGIKVINASDNTNESNTYAIITKSEKDGVCKVLITLNDTLLDDLYRQAPTKIFKYK